MTDTPSPDNRLVEIDERDALGCVNRAIREAKSNKAFADKCGISPQNLSNQMNHIDRKISDNVLAAAGIRVVRTRKLLYPVSLMTPAMKSRYAPGDGSDAK